MTDVELAILRILRGRYGKQHAITREELVHKVNSLCNQSDPIKDRTVREAIENLRQTHAIGARIMSSSGWSGYWLMEGIEEFAEFHDEQRNRALTTMVGLRKQRDLLKREWHEPQMELFNA